MPKDPFVYHAPDLAQVDRLKVIREHARSFRDALRAQVPEGRELSLALTNLQQTVMWANAGVVLAETPGEG